MTIDGQFLTLITPVAIVTAILSGIAFAWVLHRLQPAASAPLVTYLLVTVAALWYVPQAAQLWAVNGTGFGTLGRMSLFLVGFIVPAHLTLRWLQRRTE